MNRFLLDTHVLLWWLADDARIGPKTVERISDMRNEIFVSAVTSWEIAIKKKIGKLEAPDNIDGIVEDEGFSKLPVTLHHGEIAGGLPLHHKDPFDRMLVAQAKAEALYLLTDDGSIRRYDVPVISPLD
ncbi:MAG: type II toxin-antitoxin system VapC family toxin [Candidatus Electrothrix sp. LOE2]|nr:type II toxin-antitoxin system VapC family toxin [Candidatus Electrothrix sp. LOE2]